MKRRDLIIGSLAAAFSASLKGSASGLLHAFIPRAESRRLRIVSVGTPVPVADNAGDTWVAAWADDDNLYSPSNDTEGFHKLPYSNLYFNRIEGSDPLHLSGETVNRMTGYGKGSEEGPDGCTWKSSGCTSIDGALYWVVARHKYGDAHHRQMAQNASIIKSTDYGRTWTRPADENYRNPMFPGQRFATPYFIQYGHKGSGRAYTGDYVYAVANNGFWDCGDDMVLGRVERAKIGLLNGSDWEYYSGGNGELKASWSKSMNDAKHILKGERKFGMTGAVYLHEHKRYFMIGWYYPDGGGNITKESKKHTVWDFYESPQPWGPWNRIGVYDSQPSGYYCPGVCPKFQSADKLYVFTAGDWKSPPDYRLTVVPLEIGT